MNQIDLKTQGRSENDRDENLFDAHAVSKAEQVVPIAGKSSGDGSHQPLVAIQDSRRNFKPLMLGFILFLLLGAGAWTILRSSFSTNTDINDEADITDFNDPKTTEIVEPKISAAEIKSDAVSVEKNEPISAPKKVSAKLPPERKIIKPNKIKPKKVKIKSRSLKKSKKKSKD